MKKIILLIACALFVTACSTNKTEKEDKSASTEINDLSSNILINIRENSVETPEEVQLINEANAYHIITTKINMIRKPGINFPEIDFTKHSLIVINTEIKDQSISDYNVSTKLNNGKVSVELTGFDNPEFKGLSPQIRLLKLVVIDKATSLEGVTYTP